MINILVVEDDKHVRRLLEAVLKREGYDVVTAEDGVKALEVLDSQHIDLIILDIMMPNMDGYEFAKEVRDADSLVPILMATAKQLPEDKKKGFRIGTDDYMTKPIDTEEMLLRIQALLRRSQIASARKLVVGKVILDYDALTVTREDEKQTLPQKNSICCISCCPILNGFSRASSLWTRYGAWKVKVRIQPLMCTSIACGNGLTLIQSLNWFPSEVLDTRRCEASEQNK